MSVRSAGRGRAAARSIRLALRSLSIVATKSASLPRRVFRCRGSRCASSASIPAASRSIPLIPIPAQSITGRGQHARSTPSTKLMDGKDCGAHPPSDLAPGSVVGDSGQLRRHGSRWCGVVGGIATVAAAIGEDIRGHLPRQHKAQREGLALLTATMLDVRSANLMDLAASLPRAAERPDMRYQWISRLLGNALIEVDAVMAPYAREVLARLAADGRTVVLMIDQTRATERPPG